MTETGSGGDDVAIIHIHEDDSGMRNLFPLTARREVSDDLGAARASAEDNRVPSGAGWKAVHVIASPSVSYIESGLLAATVAEGVSPHMPRVRHFYETASGSFGSAKRDPWGSYDDDAWAFGFGAHCYLKLEVEGDLVKNIWFDLSSDAPGDVTALRRSLEAIDAMVPSFIGDYVMDTEVEVSDGASLDRYFADHKAEMAAIHQWVEQQRPTREAE